MKAIIQKPDLDTCLTALIMGVSEKDEIIVSRSDASNKDIMDPEVLCIEAGGSGLVELNNFDHHNTDKYFPPACRQAYLKITDKNYPSPQPSPTRGEGICGETPFQWKMGNKEWKVLDRLVEYVCIVDDRPQTHPPIEFPSLSNIFSGMLLIERNPVLQLFKGIGMLKRVLEDTIDPFSTMPDIEEWSGYKEAKRINKQKVDEVMKEAEFFNSVSSVKIGYCESEFIGGIGVLYSQGCDVAVMFNQAFGEPPVPKYTIAGNNKKVVHLVDFFDRIENGWGGKETIIGSPRNGTMLNKSQVLEILINNL